MQHITDKVSLNVSNAKSMLILIVKFIKIVFFNKIFKEGEISS